MILRFSLPLQIRVFAPTSDPLNCLQTEFEHKDLRCLVRLVGGDVVSISNVGLDKEMSEFVAKIAPDRRCHRDITQLECDIHDSGKLQKNVEERDFEKLSKLLHTIANRCLRAIRNFGIVGEIQEIPLPEEGEKPDWRLRAWAVKTSPDGKVWTPLIAGGGGGEEALMAFHLKKKAEMKAVVWKKIAEAIQDDRQANPEMEITINALAHLDVKNYRMALLESVIALEIAFARFLREDLTNRRGLNKKNLNSFLTPNLTLSIRLAGLLNLALPDTEWKKIDIAKVQTAVGWRNRLVHDSGKLQNIPANQLREAIAMVVALAVYLGRQADQAAAYPQLQQFSEYFQNRFGFWPTISFLYDHNVKVRLAIVWEFPPEETIKVIREDLGSFCRQRDHRFNATNNLIIEFASFPDRLIARWREGNLERFD